MPADKKGREYARKGEYVALAVHEFKKGKLHSGKGGPKVKDRKQAVAIGLSMKRRAEEEKKKKCGQDTAVLVRAKKMASELRAHGFVRTGSRKIGGVREHVYHLPARGVKRELKITRAGMEASLYRRGSGPRLFASKKARNLKDADRFLRGGWVSGQDTAILGRHGKPGGHAGHGI